MGSKTALASAEFATKLGGGLGQPYHASSIRHIAGSQEGDEVTEREKLEREIYTLGQIVGSNAATLNSKTMSNDDRAALQRQMTTRISHLLLQKRLERLSKEARRQLAQAGHGPASLSRADLGM